MTPILVANCEHGGTAVPNFGLQVKTAKRIKAGPIEPRQDVSAMWKPNGAESIADEFAPNDICRHISASLLLGTPEKPCAADVK